MEEAGGGTKVSRGIECCRHELSHTARRSSVSSAASPTTPPTTPMALLEKRAAPAEAHKRPPRLAHCRRRRTAHTYPHEGQEGDILTYLSRGNARTAGERTITLYASRGNANGKGKRYCLAHQKAKQGARKQMIYSRARHTPTHGAVRKRYDVLP